MADYEGNGDFNYNTDGSDFKRARDGGTSVKSDDENEESAPVPEKVNEYIRELLSEKANIDHKYPNAEKLIDAGTDCFVCRARFVAASPRLVLTILRGLSFLRRNRQGPADGAHPAEGAEICRYLQRETDPGDGESACAS